MCPLSINSRQSSLQTQSSAGADRADNVDISEAVLDLEAGANFAVPARLSREVDNVIDHTVDQMMEKVRAEIGRCVKDTWNEMSSALETAGGSGDEGELVKHLNARFEMERSKISSELRSYFAAEMVRSQQYAQQDSSVADDAQKAAFESIEVRLQEMVGSLKEKLTLQWQTRADAAKQEVMEVLQVKTAATQASLENVQQRLGTASNSAAQALSEAKDITSRLESELPKMNNRIDALAQRVGEDQAGIASVSREIGSVLKPELEQLQREMASLMPLERRIAEVDSSMAAQTCKLQNAVTELEGKLGSISDSTTAKVDELQAAITHLSDELKDEMAQKERKLFASQDEMIRNTLGTFETQVALVSSSFQTDLTAVTGQIREIVGALDELKKQVAQQEEVKRTQKTFDDIIAQVEQLQTSHKQELAQNVEARVSEVDKRVSQAVDANKLGEEIARTLKRLDLLDERISGVDSLTKTLLTHTKDMISEVGKKIKSETDARIASMGTTLDALIQSSAALTERQDAHQSVIVKLREFIEKDRTDVKTKITEVAAEQTAQKTELAKVQETVNQRLVEIENAITLNIRTKMQAEISVIAAKVEQAVRQQQSQDSPKPSEPSPSSQTSPELEATVNKMQRQLSEVVSKLHGDGMDASGKLKELKRYEEESKNLVESLKQQSANVTVQLDFFKKEMLAKIAAIEKAGQTNKRSSSAASLQTPNDIELLVNFAVDRKVGALLAEHEAKVTKLLDSMQIKLDSALFLVGDQQTSDRKILDERVSALRTELTQAISEAVESAKLQMDLAASALNDAKQLTSPTSGAPSLRSARDSMTSLTIPSASLSAEFDGRLKMVESLISTLGDKLSQIEQQQTSEPNGGSGQPAGLAERVEIVQAACSKLVHELQGIREESLRVVEEAADENEKRQHALMAFHRDQMAQQAKMYQEALKNMARRLGLLPENEDQASRGLSPGDEGAQSPDSRYSYEGGARTPTITVAPAPPSHRYGPTMVRPAMIVTGAAIDHHHKQAAAGQHAPPEWQPELLHPLQIPGAVKDKSAESTTSQPPKPKNSLRGLFSLNKNK